MKSMKYMCLIAMILLASCGKKEPAGPDAGTPPPLPSVQSMAIPVFKESGLGKTTRPMVGLNFLRAAKAIDDWASAAEAVFALPATMFGLCASATPTELPDNTGWQWSAAQASYSAVLNCAVGTDSLRWTFTTTGPVRQNFVWFAGASSLTAKAGNWIINDSTAVPRFRFDYDLVALDTTTGVLDSGMVRTENVKLGHSGYGSHLKWTATGNDRRVSTHSPSTNTSRLITWNRVTGSGSYFKSPDPKKCWSSAAQGYGDIACP